MIWPDSFMRNKQLPIIVTKEVNEETDNQPIGIILSEEKDDIMVEYAMLNDNSKLIVSKYQLYLPDLEQLKNKVKEIIEK
ncbi:MAG: PDDEXK nuclease domain-containing protein [Bacteroidia bacterium]